MGELGRNLEFLMLKIVQLETVVELQLEFELGPCIFSCTLPSLLKLHCA